MSLSAFFNPVKCEHKKIAISKRFVDENGNAEKWEIKPVSEKEMQSIRKKTKAFNGTDNDKQQYMYELCARCVVLSGFKKHRASGCLRRYE